MIGVDTNEVPYYRFRNLASFSRVRHGVFTRKGGISPNPFESLNVSHRLGDTEENVRENRSRINDLLGSAATIYVNQTHGRDILVFSGPETGNDLKTLHGDALITDREGTFLGIQVADCQPVLLYDPVCNVAGAVHSGWRGSIKNIIGSTVNRMVERFGCRADDLYAGIGPSLGPCCSEFINFREEIPERFWHFRVDQNHFDFWALSVAQLCEAGLKPERVELSGLCTRCRTDLFFSYRGETLTGRFAAVIGLTDF